MSGDMIKIRGGGVFNISMKGILCVPQGSASGAGLFMPHLLHFQLFENTSKYLELEGLSTVKDPRL